MSKEKHQNNRRKLLFRETEFAIGLSSGIVELWHIEKGNNSRDVGVKTRSYQAHEARIKGMSICGGILFTGDSSGCVKGHTKEGKCIFELQTNARITCLTVTDVDNGNGDGQDGKDQMEIENLGEIKNQMSKEKVFFVFLYIKKHRNSHNRILKIHSSFEKGFIRDGQRAIRKESRKEVRNSGKTEAKDHNM